MVYVSVYYSLSRLPGGLLAMVVVVKVTGKLFDEDDPVLLRRLVSSIDGVVASTRVVVVVGGGWLARRYIGVARVLGVSNNSMLDEIGIMASRLNALLLASLFPGKAYPRPPVDLWELRTAINGYKVVAMGGLIPGQSTAAVALEAAEALGANQVIDLAAVPYVYDKDPRKHPDAKPLKEITATQLREIMEQATEPGGYQLIDNHALEIMKRSKITIKLTYYKEPENITKIINGENPGTTIKPE